MHTCSAVHCGLDLYCTFDFHLLCSHVNKKALDQYTNFTEQREELARRQTENGRAEDKIKMLIQTLDTRKDEAVERTFKVPCLQCIVYLTCPIRVTNYMLIMSRLVPAAFGLCNPPSAVVSYSRCMHTCQVHAVVRPFFFEFEFLN